MIVCMEGTTAHLSVKDLRGAAGEREEGAAEEEGRKQLRSRRSSTQAGRAEGTTKQNARKRANLEFKEQAFPVQESHSPPEWYYYLGRMAPTSRKFETLNFKAGGGKLEWRMRELQFTGLFQS